ncbi:copper chaperone PCu(A)C [Mobilicoccus sp.]|uniref:copper chaperone PCu(A)C n=1 Tax=Mobilicoccus sp. TaxID=2034349 RepID=UPI00289BAD86|nr:copper chaperone PCu(A)C [Mobilicoccus sp.]
MSRTVPLLLAVALLGLSACGDDTGAAPEATAPATTSGSSTGPVTVTDAWVKAKPDLGAMSMTGVFAVLKNTTNAPVVITGAENSASPVTELHETVTKDGRPAMQKVEGGFTLEPGATRELRPGGDHIMLMQMSTPLNPGDVVTVTLTTQDGQKIPFEAVAKTFTGGDEKYHSGSPTSGSSMPGHDMSGTPMPGMSETPTAPASS